MYPPLFSYIVFYFYVMAIFIHKKGCIDNFSMKTSPILQNKIKT